ncbi:MAG TPA: hypothetical protein VIM65_09875 [Cyclobacteriaceae bacterium]
MLLKKTNSKSITVLSLLLLAGLSACQNEDPTPAQATSTTQAASTSTSSASAAVYCTGLTKSVASTINGKNSSAIKVAFQETYRGFRLKFDATANTSTIKKAAHHQIDIIVNGGLSAGLNDMRTIKAILFYKDGTDDILYENSYVYINNLGVFPNIDKDGGTVLFHELSHYLNDKYTPGGMYNTKLVSLYNAAVKSKKYPSDAYSMANAAEYFAEDMCAYFPGQKNSAPATRAQLISWDPNMANYIKSLKF